MSPHAKGFCGPIGIILLFGSVLTAAQTAEFAGGTGEPNSPYQIATAEQLIAIGSDPNLLDKYFVLLNDIDLDPNLPGGRVFARAVIAPDTEDDAKNVFQGTPFTGRLDGKGHTIRNLTIRSGGRAFLGLFGFIGKGGQVRALHVEDTYVGGTDSCRCLGMLAGYVEQCTIVNCSVTGRIAAGNSARSLGGLVGFAFVDGRILQCSASGEISAGDQSTDLGGLVGDNGGALTNCFARGTISGGQSSANLGGLVGRNSPSGIMPESGQGTSPGSILHCYAAMRVQGGHSSMGIGGLVGQDDKHSPGVVVESYWDMEATGLLNSAGGLGLFTAHLQSALVYGWDFVGERDNGTADLWLLPGAGQYPVLTTLLDAPPAHPLAGKGTADDPYRVFTPEDLGAISHHDASACYQLMNDIDLSGIEWSTAPICVFDGRFEGGGFVISHLSLSGHSYLGLFDSLGPNASVINLRVLANIVGGERSIYVGALAGRSEGLVSGCRSDGSATGEDFVGGLVGWNGKRGIITNSYATGFVSGTGWGSDAGGLAGANAGTITNSHASVVVAGDESSLGVGGLVGGSGGHIAACYATGRITGNEYLGGLVGRNSGTVSDSYAAVDIYSREEFSAHVGGLVGSNHAQVMKCYSVSVTLNAFNEPMYGAGLTGWGDPDKWIVTDSFWDIQATEIAESLGGGGGLTTAQMQTATTFTNAGWDLGGIWTICEGKDYPRLRWEKVPCNK